MRAYLAIKFKEDHSNQKLIEDLSILFKELDVETYVMARDFEKWGEVKNIGPEVLMTETFKVIDESDFVVIEFSEKGVGLGIEAGYAYSKTKPIIVIAKEGSEISATLQGVAKDIIFYNQPGELVEKLKKLLKKRSTGFIIIRPDNKVLMQRRDENSRKYKNMWCFPGGGCKPGEEHLDALVREMKEEYELSANKENCELLMTRVLGRQHIYICHIDGTQKAIMHEGAEMRWMSIDEIKKLPIAFNQGDIVRKLDGYLESKT